MPPHVVVLAFINSLRGLCGLVLGGLLVYFSDRARYPSGRLFDVASMKPRYIEGDFQAFLVVGVVFMLLAILRLVQGSITIAEWRRASRSVRRERGKLGAFSRRLGLGLSVLDLIDLTFFPVTTACGLYGLLVYRSPDSIEFFEGKFST